MAFIAPASAQAGDPGPPAATCAGETATIVGTNDDDSGPSINGTAGDDVIAAYGGNDVIDGGGGQDLICAGDGNDTVTTLGADDRVLGQDGDDDISTGGGTDYLDGGRGTDTCDGGGQELDRIIGCTNPTEFTPGLSAPDLVARTAFDNKFRLSDLEGQHVLIDFSTI